MGDWKGTFGGSNVEFSIIKDYEGIFEGNIKYKDEFYSFSGKKFKTPTGWEIEFADIRSDYVSGKLTYDFTKSTIELIGNINSVSGKLIRQESDGY